MIYKVKSILKGGAEQLRLWVLLFFSAIAFTAAAGNNAVDLSNFRLVRNAVLPENAYNLPNKTYAIGLDESFFQITDNPANDLCILDSAGDIVPFVLKKIPAVIETPRENQLAGKIVSSQQLPDGRNALDVELAENGKFISQVELVGGKFAPGTLLTIAVGDGRSWQIAIDKLKLSDISKLGELNRRFSLPVKLTGKIVRLIVEKGKFPPLEAVRLFEQQLEPVQGTQYRDYAVTVIGSKSDDNMLKIVCNTHNAPLTRIKLKLADQLYLNKVTILGSSDRRKWQPIGSGSIRKIDLDCIDTLDFPESRYRFIMLNIEQQPEKPVKVQEIQAGGPAYNWLVNGGKNREKLTLYCQPATVQANANHQLIADSKPHASYILSAPQANKLHKTGVHDRSSWTHLAGALIVIITFIATAVLTAQVKRSNKILPED